MLRYKQTPLTRQQRVALLSHRRATLEERAQKAQEELAALDVELASLALVYTLPDDIWADILELAYAHHFPECHTEQFVPDQYPVPISRVSRYFRNLSLSLPNLWTCLHITPRPQTDPHRDHAGLVRAQLDRSRGRPLTVLFACNQAFLSQPPFWRELSDFLESDEFKHFSLCWKLIVPHAGRWRRLSFHAKFNHIIARFLRQDVFDKTLSMPLLEHLDVCGEDKYGDRALGNENTVSFLDITHLDTPQLKCLRGCGFRWRIESPSPVGFPITELVLSGVHRYSPPDHEFAELLNSVAATLTTLIIVDVEISGTVPFIRLPRLRYLTLDRVDSEHFTIDSAMLVPAVGAFLDGAPRLERLDVKEFGNRWEWEDLFAFFTERTYPSIRILEPEVLEELGLNPEFLEAFPNVEHLLFSNDNSSRLTQGLLEHSKWAHEEGYLVWPHLKQISVMFSGTKSPFFEVMREFVDHRADIGCPLKVLNIGCCPCEPGTTKFTTDFARALPSRVEFAMWPDPDVAKHMTASRWDDCANAPAFPYWTRETLPKPVKRRRAASVGGTR